MLVDVLTFTTDVELVVARGGSVVPAAERADVEAPWSRAPSSLVDFPAGGRLVLPSPNGSALAAGAVAHGAGVVLAACLRNASAVATACRGLGGTVAVIAAGERWGGWDGPLRPAVEDLLAAGAVLGGLDGLSPEAEVAVSAFAGCRHALPAVVADCTSGLEWAGRTDDLELASALDVSDAVPVLRDGAFVALD